MKRFSRVLFVAAAVAALPGAALAGGDHHRGRRAECRAAFEATHLPTYDRNRDGTLDRAERQAFRQDRRRQALARYDADRDGRLGEVEWMKMRRDRVAQKFGRLDRNRDGFITRGEANQSPARAWPAASTGSTPTATAASPSPSSARSRCSASTASASAARGAASSRTLNSASRKASRCRRSSLSRSWRRSRRPSRSRRPTPTSEPHARHLGPPKMKRGTPAACADVPRRTSRQCYGLYSLMSSAPFLNVPQPSSFLSASQVGL